MVRGDETSAQLRRAAFLPARAGVWVGCDATPGRRLESPKDQRAAGGWRRDNEVHMHGIASLRKWHAAVKESSRTL
jgi:hypothetical protein